MADELHDFQREGVKELTGKVRTISVEPDGMLSAAFNIAQKLQAKFGPGTTEDFLDLTEGELMVLLHESMVEQRALISKSTWLTGNAQLGKMRDFIQSIVDGSASGYGTWTNLREQAQKILDGE